VKVNFNEGSTFLEPQMETLEFAIKPNNTDLHASYFATDTAKEPALHPKLQKRIEADFLPRWNDTWKGRFVLHGCHVSPDAVRLDGNDYLSLTGHPEISQAQIASIRQDNDFVIQSGAFLLDQHPSRNFEKSMARWMGKEDGFLCQSGYSANVGLLQCIANAETPVFIDMMAHTSLWEGAHTARAPSFPFRHNDPEHLDKTLARHGPGVVVVDSVYSTTGAVCPLVEMVEVVEKHGAMILVDESHSLGTHGPYGAGLVAALGLAHRVHFITASLAKAFAGRAGFFTMPTALRYYVLSTSFPNIFSSCMLPHEIAALTATQKVIQQSDQARTRLQANTKQMRERLSELGYPIHQGTEQIIALEAGTEPETMALRDALEERDVFGSIFCAPATSRNRALVRLTVNAGLTQAEIDHVIQVATEIAPKIKPWDWAIARKVRNAQTTR
jgi:CAI-1 autoinducer synthase